MAKSRAKPPSGQADRQTGKYSQVRVSGVPIQRNAGPPPAMPSFDGETTSPQVAPAPPNESGPS